MSVLDQVQQRLDNSYPSSSTVQGIATSLRITDSEAKTALDSLVNFRRALKESDQVYQSAILSVKNKLDSILPNSTTASTLATLLAMTPVQVQTDLDRLVILNQATKGRLGGTGEIQYKSTATTTT